ncbi:MAG: nucleoside hydrolase [Bacteroidota bacterium]
MKSYKFLLLTIVCLSINGMISAQPEPIIFDTDMGSDCDDAGALAMLNLYVGQGKAEMLGCIYSSSKVPYGAGIIDAINTYYGRPDIPIGADQSMQFGDPKDKMTAEKLAKDTAAFHNTIIHNEDAREQTGLSRELLTQQPDNSVTYLTVGHTKGLYELMHSGPDEISPLTGYELVTKKVKRWVAMGAPRARNEDGFFAKDWNFFFNETAPYTRYLIDNFPKPSVFIACGEDVLTGKSLKTIPSGNIVRIAYRDWLWNVFQKTLDEQRPSWDLIAVYYAVEGLGEYLRDVGNGKLLFDVDKGAKWIETENPTNHEYIIVQEGKKDEFSKYLNKLIAQ